jgi:hypothetical protein
MASPTPTSTYRKRLHDSIVPAMAGWMYVAAGSPIIAMIRQSLGAKAFDASVKKVVGEDYYIPCNLVEGAVKEYERHWDEVDANPKAWFYSDPTTCIFINKADLAVAEAMSSRTRRHPAEK